MATVIDDDVELAVGRGVGRKLFEKAGIRLVSSKYMGTGSLVFVLFCARGFGLDKVQFDVVEILEPGVVRRTGAVVLYL